MGGGEGGRWSRGGWEERSRKERWRGSAICYHMYLHIAFPKQHTKTHDNSCSSLNRFYMKTLVWVVTEHPCTAKHRFSRGWGEGEIVHTSQVHGPMRGYECELLVF